MSVSFKDLLEEDEDSRIAGTFRRNNLADTESGLVEGSTNIVASPVASQPCDTAASRESLDYGKRIAPIKLSTVIKGNSVTWRRIIPKVEHHKSVADEINNPGASSKGNRKFQLPVKHHSKNAKEYMKVRRQAEPYKDNACSNGCVKIDKSVNSSQVGAQSSRLYIPILPKLGNTENILHSHLKNIGSVCTNKNIDSSNFVFCKRTITPETSSETLPSTFHTQFSSQLVHKPKENSSKYRSIGSKVSRFQNGSKRSCNSSSPASLPIAGATNLLYRSDMKLDTNSQQVEYCKSNISDSSYEGDQYRTVSNFDFDATKYSELNSIVSQQLDASDVNLQLASSIILNNPVVLAQFLSEPTRNKALLEELDSVLYMLFESYIAKNSNPSYNIINSQPLQNKSIESDLHLSSPEKFAYSPIANNYGNLRSLCRNRLNNSPESINSKHISSLTSLNNNSNIHFRDTPSNPSLELPLIRSDSSSYLLDNLAKYHENNANILAPLDFEPYPGFNMIQLVRKLTDVTQPHLNIDDTYHDTENYQKNKLLFNFFDSASRKMSPNFNSNRVRTKGSKNVFQTNPLLNLSPPTRDSGNLRMIRRNASAANMERTGRSCQDYIPPDNPSSVFHGEKSESQVIRSFGSKQLSELVRISIISKFKVNISYVCLHLLRLVEVVCFILYLNLFSFLKWIRVPKILN